MKKPNYMHQFNISDHFKLNKEREIHLKKLDHIYKDHSHYYGSSKPEKKEKSPENIKHIATKSVKIKNDEIQKENSILLSRLLTISEKPSTSIPRFRRRNDSQTLVSSNVAAPTSKEPINPKNESKGLFSILNNKYKKNVALNMALENKRIVETLKKIETTIPTLKALEKTSLIQRIEKFKKQDNNHVMNDLEKKIFKRKLRPLSEDRNSKSPKPATTPNHRVNQSFQVKPSERKPRDETRLNATTILSDSNKRQTYPSNGKRPAGSSSRSQEHRGAKPAKDSTSNPVRPTTKPRVQSASAGQKSPSREKSKKQTAFMQAENMLKHLLHECQDILRDSTLVDETKPIPENIPLNMSESTNHSKEYQHEQEDELYEMKFHSLRESEDRATSVNS